MITDADMAWCAGVVDTLGNIRTRDISGSVLAAVFISTPSFPLAKRLADLTGVKVTTVNRSYNRVGCSDHCTEPHLHVTSSTARWSLTGGRAVVFLTCVTPYLVVKADVVTAVLEATADASFKPATVAKMTALGWSNGRETA